MVFMVFFCSFSLVLFVLTCIHDLKRSKNEDNKNGDPFFDDALILLYNLKTKKFTSYQIIKRWI